MIELLSTMLLLRVDRKAEEQFERCIGYHNWQGIQVSLGSFEAFKLAPWHFVLAWVGIPDVKISQP
jgi:hypothetical protein